MSRPKTLIQPHFKVSGIKKFVLHAGSKLKIGQTNSVSTHSEQYFSLIQSAVGGKINQLKKNAIDDFVKNAQRKGYWDQLVGFYLPIWGNSVANKYNLKDPTSKELTFYGSISHEDGYIRGAAGAYADPSINPSVDGLTNDSGLLAFNSLTDLAQDSIDIGAYGSILQRMYIQSKSSSNNFKAAMYNNSNVISGTSSSSQGFFVLNRNSSSSLELYKDSSLIGSNTSSAGTVVNQNIFFMAVSSGGTSADSSTRDYNMFSVSKGITNISDFNSDVSSLLSQI